MSQSIPMPAGDQDPLYRNLKFNYIVNIFDGGFFGFALGLASFSTVLPLFVATMTDSAVLIGLIPAIHIMGWQLPQLMTAKMIARLRRYKPFVMLATVHERIPFIGLAVIALLYPNIDNGLALALTFLFLIWQGLGGGITANPWQNMIARIIPPDFLATFFGLQSAAANLLGSVGAVAAGYLLDRFGPNDDFAICFGLAAFLMLASLGALGMTREPERATLPPHPYHNTPLLKTIGVVLRGDKNFRSFLIVRWLSQFGLMAFSFYTVFAVKYHGMDEVTAGLMTSVLLISQVVSNPILGRIADRWSRKYVLIFGALAITASSLLAWMAPALSWFVVVFILAGIANTAFWTVIMAMSLGFGTEEERPTYVGMANTLTAPAAILAPLAGGWLADAAGYPVTFISAGAAGLVTALVLWLFVKDPRKATSPE